MRNIELDSDQTLLEPRSEQYKLQKFHDLFQQFKSDEHQITAVRLHVYLVFVKSIEQELKIQWEYRSHRNFDFKRPYLGNEKW